MTQAVEMWLIAQMKAYNMLMKNWALICGLGHLCKEISKLWMWVILWVRIYGLPMSFEIKAFHSLYGPGQRLGLGFDCSASLRPLGS